MNESSSSPGDAEFRPDPVVLDWQMPGEIGETFLRNATPEIRQHETRVLEAYLTSLSADQKVGGETPPSNLSIVDSINFLIRQAESIEPKLALFPDNDQAQRLRDDYTKWRHSLDEVKAAFSGFTPTFSPN